MVLLFLVLLSLYGCSPPEPKPEAAPAGHHEGGGSALPASSSVRLMEGMGKVDFPITTRSKEAQAFFNQGVAQLYGFWFMEAEQSFRQTVKLDPGAAMGYWGIAMAATADFVPTYQLLLPPTRSMPIIAPPNSPEARVREAIARAQALQQSITPRESLYIEAVAARHNPNFRDPESAYIAGMRRVVEASPDDLNAKCILALVLESGYVPATRAAKPGTLEALKLLRQVLAKDSEHVGASHFLIHGLEGSKNIREALPVAERYAKIVTNIPHAVHMPGHVYAQIGMFDEAVKSFLQAAAKEREYISADPQYSKMHYLHNEILLLHVLGSQGNFRDATARITELMSRNPDPAEPEAAAFYRIGWFSLMRVLVRFEKWNDILDGKTMPFLKQPFETVWYHWAQGLAHASTSDVGGARNSLRLMDETLDSIRPMVSPLPAQFVVARSELASYIDAKAGEPKKGLAGLERAAKGEAELPYTDPTVYPRPVLELLGRTALEARDFKTAEAAYRRALENEPGSGRGFWGLAAALKGLGKKQEAEQALTEFHRVWRGEEFQGRTP
jgi:tetratricopeptide (TPR) repeat protein